METLWLGRRTCSIGCAIAMLALAKPLWCGEPKGSAKITPDPKIQAAIGRVVKALDANGREKALRELIDMTVRSGEMLPAQLIHYSLQVRDEREAWAVLGLMRRFNGSDERQGLIPLLESSDKNVHREACGWLLAIDELNRPKRELIAYREVLRRHKKAPPPGLVNYLYDHAPSEAALLFEEIYLGQEGILRKWPQTLLWSDHVINTVTWRMENVLLKEGDLQRAEWELTALSRHDGWYARRYVVAVLQRTPKLGTAEIVKRLKNDANPLVAEAAKLLK